MSKPDLKDAEKQKPVWFITGCSTGFGRALALELIENGFRTVVTARNRDDIKDLASHNDVLALTLDVTDATEIEAAVKAAQDRFGHIDVLVNNAGIGYFSAIEEGENKQIRRMFDINLFGLNQMIQAVLPNMRERRSGFIVNISSIGGLSAFPAMGFYNATKFAVEGLSEALWQEVEPLGIKVLLVEPSGFQTDWAGRSANESKTVIEDYAETAGKARKQVRDISGHQAGDPVRAAKAIVSVVSSKNPPHRLLLGNNAFDEGIRRLEVLRKDFTSWESTSRGADFPDSAVGRPTAGKPSLAIVSDPPT